MLISLQLFEAEDCSWLVSCSLGWFVMKCRSQLSVWCSVYSPAGRQDLPGVTLLDSKTFMSPELYFVSPLTSSLSESLWYQSMNKIWISCWEEWSVTCLCPTVIQSDKITWSQGPLTVFTGWSWFGLSVDGSASLWLSLFTALLKKSIWPQWNCD